MSDQIIATNIMLGVSMGLIFAFFIIALICAIWAFIAYSKVVGFENSTHRIEYHNPFKDSEDDQDEINPFEKPLTEKEQKEQKKLMNIALGQADPETGL